MDTQIVKLNENCEVSGIRYKSANVDEMYISIAKDSDVATNLLKVLENASGPIQGTGDNLIYSIEYKETGGWIHIGVTDTDIQIGQCIRIVAF